LRREYHPGDSGQRAVHPRSGARGVQVFVWGEKDSGADSVHPEDGKDAAELTNFRFEVIYIIGIYFIDE
jgi:hypothetical protein